MYILNAESGTGFICTALTWPSSGMGEMQVQGAKHARLLLRCHLYIKNDDFTKTGSGQTQGKHYSKKKATTFI